MVLSRRAAMLAAVPLVASQPAAAASPVREGMAAFSDGKVEESIEIFDSIIAQKPSAKPYLWQRGLSLYYADRFKDGAEQFATDVAVNPNDTEESIWNFLCVARTDGFDKARQTMLKVGVDRRPVMRAALELFSGAADEAPLQAYAKGLSPSDQFYSNLYLGLFREAKGDVEGSKGFMRAAVSTAYARGSGDCEKQSNTHTPPNKHRARRPRSTDGCVRISRPRCGVARFSSRVCCADMADLARVHVKRRGW